MTIEELIERCGDKISNLWRVPDGFLEVSTDKSRWIVVGQNDMSKKGWISGNTPREALEKFYESIK